jgi:hypothetical protein
LREYSRWGLILRDIVYVIICQTAMEGGKTVQSLGI